ncbi:MAG: SGNH/GDSL hydrolase family protein [Planctomycetes bacterium]|nr:SGNH/GDSL hydrolase family protein [Planctomycetota bacterium]
MKNATDFDPAMAAQNPDLAEIQWLSPFESELQLNGLVWNTDNNIIRRLPTNDKGDIPEAVDHLANSPTGVQIRFCTNSKRIAIQVTLANVSSMVHMASTGISGCDLYVKKDGKFIFYAASKYDHKQAAYALLLFQHEDSEEREFLINLPLYEGVDALHVGIDETASISSPPAFSYDKRIVVYGTSVTQGGCASRPGMCYTNILSRALNAEIINLGFSGSGKGEPALAQYISQIKNTGLLVLDYQANTGAVGIAKTMAAFVDILRAADADVPILVISKPPNVHALIQAKDQAHTESENAWQENFVSERQQAGDTNIYFLDGCTAIEERFMEGTVDGIHPNDLGFALIAEHWLPTLKEILGL